MSIRDSVSVHSSDLDVEKRSRGIESKDHIPLFQKVMFSLGQNMDYVATSLMTSVMWMPFFNIGMGLNPIVLGVILMLLRAWDAFTDPVMGNISDNTRGRWGRRRPYMIIGAIATAALYPFIWHIPEGVVNGSSWLSAFAQRTPFFSSLGMSAKEMGVSLYLVLIGMVFFASFSCWSMPYYGLQLELTPNYDERTRLTAVMALISKLTALVTGWAFVAVVFVGTVARGDIGVLKNEPRWLKEIVLAIQPWLKEVAIRHLDEQPIVVGMRLMCWPLALMIFVFGILPALFVKERYYEKEVSRQVSEPLLTSVKESLSCGPLWSLIGASFFLVMGYSAIGGLSQYVNIYYICSGDMLLAGTIAGVKGTVLAVSGVAMLPVFTWLGERYDKRRVVLMMLGVGIFGHLLNIFLMSPRYPYLQIISGIFEASAIAAVWMFLPSMKADVADYDEQCTTRRREGSINSFYSWFIKMSLTLSMGIGGVVLQVSGFDAGNLHQSGHVLNSMFLMYLVIPAFIWSLAIVAIWFYPLSRNRCDEIRACLEARRGAL